MLCGWLLSLRVSLRASVHFLVAFVLSLLQTWPREKPSLVMQLYDVLRFHLVLASMPRWIVLFHLMLVKGELRLYQLFCGVGLAHLPTLVLPMVGVQWILHG